MSTYKNTSGDLILTGNGGLATLTINYANTIFNGSFTYTGNLTTTDDFIVVAANNTGTIQDMGLLAQTGTGTFAGLRFDTVANAWQISSSVTSAGVPITAYTSIASGNTGIPGGNVAEVQLNNGTGGFTANATFKYDTANSQMILVGYQTYGNIGYTPSYTGNGVAVYNNTMGSGGTGLYVKNSSVDDELVSKSKAIIYSIIF
jgi:hypothetical protein